MGEGRGPGCSKKVKWSNVPGFTEKGELEAPFPSIKALSLYVPAGLILRLKFPGELAIGVKLKSGVGTGMFLESQR
jgi:hypothetical protein